MTDTPLPHNDTPQSRLPGSWKVRRVVGLTAPVIVVALAAASYARFHSAVQEDPSDGSADTAVADGVVLLSPMGMIALIGFLFAYSTRGTPARGSGLLSVIVNLLLTVVLIVPAIIVFPIFLHLLPFLLSDAAHWVLARLGW